MTSRRNLCDGSGPGNIPDGAQAQAAAIEIEDITSDEGDRSILRRLRDNDPRLTLVFIEEGGPGGDDDGGCEYCFNGHGHVQQSKWLGQFLGKNLHVKNIALFGSPFHSRESGAKEMIESVCNGLRHNESIQSLCIDDWDATSLYSPFLVNIRNLTKLRVTFSGEGYRSLSLALAGMDKSLEKIKIADGDERWLEESIHFTDVIVSLSMHPRLKELRLAQLNLGLAECTALATLLRWKVTEIQTLSLWDIHIDDDGVDLLVDGLAHCSELRELRLGRSHLTARGLTALASLLKHPSSNLEGLRFYSPVSSQSNGGEMHLFADALTGNRKLTTLGIPRIWRTGEGWSSLSRLLCNTSSINDTFLSNHTLESLGGIAYGTDPLPEEISNLIRLNRSGDKNVVAMRKMLTYHDNFDMSPFFEWDLKVLPFVVGWFDRAAAACSADFDETYVGKKKLSAIYQYIRGMPMVVIAARTRQEIEEINASKMQMHCEQLKLERMQLELAKKIKAAEDGASRAMRRL